MRFPAVFRCQRRGVRLAPLIDVVFILLLFFMLTTGFVPWRQINVTFPMSAEQATESDILVVLVVDDGRTLVVAGDRYRLDDASGLAARIAEQPQATYAVRGFAGMRTQTLVDVVDRLRQAGAARVLLAKTRS